MSEKIHPGDRFGKLTVLSDSGGRRTGYILWNCRCDCGNDIVLSTKDLNERGFRDCGCTTRIRHGANDLTGRRFGKLTVLYPTEKRSDQGSVVWHAVCDCGNECDVSARRLTRGKVRSCGCLSKPPLKDYIGRTFGRWTVLEYAGTAKERNLPGSAIFWKCRCSCGNEGIVRQTELQNGESQSCGCLQKERFLESLKLVGGTSVVCLEKGQKILRSDNASGKTGVCYYSRKQKWAAYITFRKKRYMLGLFDDKRDAVCARTNAEKMHEDFIDWYYREYLPINESVKTPQH